MSKTALAAYRVKLATDVCTDYSIGQKVFAYLEKTVAEGEETAAFVSHAGECSFCMQTIIKWHYDCVVTEMDDMAAEVNAGSALMTAFGTKPSIDWPSGQSITNEDVPETVDNGLKIGTSSKADKKAKAKYSGQ